MDLGIIGLPKSGKTTTFNALTGGHAETSAFGHTGLEQNLGVVKVPDSRLDRVAALVRPKRITPAEVRYLDVRGSSRGAPDTRELFVGPLLNVLGGVDALIHVVRAFSNPSLPHPSGTVDPGRDIEAMNLELAFADALQIERRLERLTNGLKAAKPSQREAAALEHQWLQEVKAQLEAEVPVREVDLSEAQRQALANYALLTAKPLLIILNIGEEQLGEATALEQEYQRRYSRPGVQVLALCAQLEMDLGRMGPQEARDFRAALDLPEPGVDRVIRASYQLLGVLSFFTMGPEEARAWTLRRGMLAPQAAGKIHSDMERGFIRAEAVSWEHLLESGSWAEARRRGYLRSEGKHYAVQEGDVLLVLFSH